MRLDKLFNLVCRYCDENATCSVCRLRQFGRMIELIELENQPIERAAKQAQRENMAVVSEGHNDNRYTINGTA